MIYRFIDSQGTFRLKDPHKYNFYFPLTDAAGRLLSAIAPNLSGDIKKDNEHFLTLPASSEDLRSSPLCRREFFIKTGKKVLRLSRPCQDTLEAGFLYQKIHKKALGLKIEILNFIPHDLPVEVMRIKVRNVSSKEAWITPTSFIPLFGRSEKNLRDHRHVSSLLNRVKLDKFGIFLKPSMIFDEKGHKLNREIYFALGYEGSAAAPLGQFPALDYFYGEGDIFSPDAVFKDIVPVNRAEEGFDGKEVCAAFRFEKKKLSPRQESEYVLLLGIEEKENRIKDNFARLNSPEKVERAFEENRKYWREYLAGLKFDFKDRNKNGWLAWVMLQPVLRKLFGCSFLPHFDYGKGGRGWRDLWQDALALLLTEPSKAKEIIIGSFSGVRLDGSNATIIAKDGSFMADRNRINRVWMDHGIWPYLTTRHYLNRTGDISLLLKNQTYFRDHQLKRAKAVDTFGGAQTPSFREGKECAALSINPEQTTVFSPRCRRIDSGFCQKDFIQRDGKNRAYAGSILEHILIQNLTQFFNVGSHNIIRLENADWNDGLDMASENGEGAAFSFMYAHNLKSLCGLLRVLEKKQASVSLLKEVFILLDTLNSPVDYGDFRAKQKRLDEYFKQSENIRGGKVKVRLKDLIADLEAKSRHMFEWLAKKEWLKEGFFNGYYDNQSKRVEGKRGNSLRVMLTSQVFAIMSGVASDEQVGLAWKAIKKYLQDEKFGGFRLNTNFKKPYLELGRAFGFSYGDKENGAFFSHMNVMLANALYKRGFIKEGKEVMDSIYEMAAAEKAGIPPVLPEYINSQGKGLYLYLTGSASWYIYTLFEEILGIKFELGEILLEPKLLAGDFTSSCIETEFFLFKKRIKLIYKIKKNALQNKPLVIKEACLSGQKLLFTPLMTKELRKGSLRSLTGFTAGTYRIKPSLLKSAHNLIILTLG